MQKRALWAIFDYRWRALDKYGKQSFAAIAKSITWPNRLGVHRHPSAKQLFFSVNLLADDRQLDINAHTPDENAPLGFFLTQSLDSTLTPMPLYWSVAFSMSTGIETYTDPSWTEDDLIYEFFYISLNCTPGQTGRPQTWLKVGRQIKDLATLQWAPWMYRVPWTPAVGQTIGWKLVWLYARGVQTAPVTGTVAITA
jgi:hypothetical protein